MSKYMYIIYKHICIYMDTYGIPDGSNGKEPACSARVVADNIKGRAEKLGLWG